MKKVIRFAIYFLGLATLSLGVVLNTKTTLGVAPINSIAVCVTVLSGISLGNTTLGLHIVFVIGQAAIKRKNFKWYDLLQVPVSVVFSMFISLYDGMLQLNPEAIWAKLAILAAACILTGIGLSMILDMRIVPCAPDGLTLAFADALGRETGFVKNIFDFACVLVTVAIGLVFGGRVIGIGAGTIVTMIAVGRIVWFFNRLFKNKILAIAGMEEREITQVEEEV
ncbi:MAG: YitT family protein [Oscillospiraceae bacterium]